MPKSQLKIHNTMPRLLLTLATSLTLFGACAISQAADPANGRVLARQCSACHGKLGLSRDPEAPNLAGQSAFYLEKSLKDYREGIREDRRMSLMAQNLTDEQIKDLAAWYASIRISVEEPE